jgi:GNAT superfamily N-acetyltransferase
MTIRFATLNDLPSLVEGGSRMHALTRFRNQPYNPQKVAQAFCDLITRGQGKYAFLVAAHADGRIVGALIGVMEQQIFTDTWTASVMHFDVLPEARMGGYGVRLLRAFEQWARNRRAVEFCFGVNSDAESDAVGRFARKMGYRQVGENFVKRGEEICQD